MSSSLSRVRSRVWSRFTCRKFGSPPNEDHPLETDLLQWCGRLVLVMTRIAKSFEVRLLLVTHHKLAHKNTLPQRIELGAFLPTFSFWTGGTFRISSVWVDLLVARGLMFLLSRLMEDRRFRRTSHHRGHLEIYWRHGKPQGF